MMKKLGVNNVAGLTQLALAAGLAHWNTNDANPPLEISGAGPDLPTTALSTARLAQPEVAMVADAAGARSPQQKQIQVAQRK